MNNTELQEAIDKTRTWLMLQIDAATTPSLKAKDDAVIYLTQLQNLQIQRAVAVTTSQTMIKEKTND